MLHSVETTTRSLGREPVSSSLSGLISHVTVIPDLADRRKIQICIGVQDGPSKVGFKLVTGIRGKVIQLTRTDHLRTILLTDLSNTVELSTESSNLLTLLVRLSLKRQKLIETLLEGGLVLNGTGPVGLGGVKDMSSRHLIKRDTWSLIVNRIYEVLPKRKRRLYGFLTRISSSNSPILVTLGHKMNQVTKLSLIKTSSSLSVLEEFDLTQILHLTNRPAENHQSMVYRIFNIVRHHYRRSLSSLITRATIDQSREICRRCWRKLS